MRDKREGEEQGGRERERERVSLLDFQTCYPN
jgi:hypothetical protein